MNPNDTVTSRSMRPAPTRVASWCLAAMLVSVAFNWFLNARIMTPDAYHSLLAPRMDLVRIARFMDALDRTLWYSYLMTPVMVLGRLLAVALLVQFFLLCFGVELRLRQGVAAAACANFALLAHTALRFTHLWQFRNGGLTEMQMAIQPLSVATLLLDPAAHRTPAYVAASLLNVGELAWLITLVACLGAWAAIPLARRFEAGLATWITTAAIQGAIALLFFSANT